MNMLFSLLISSISLWAAPKDFIVTAHWGAHHPLRENVQLKKDSCFAELVADPEETPESIRYLVDNTLPAVSRAFALGANMVSLNLQVSKDGEVVLFHDQTLDCRTNGSGKISEHNLKDLKKLNMAHNYTADNGKTYPWRDGKNVSSQYTTIPTLQEVLEKNSGKRFWFVMRPNNLKELDAVVSVLNKFPSVAKQSYFYYEVAQGGDDWVNPQLIEKIPDLKRPMINFKSSKQCLGKFKPGNTVPVECDSLDLFVPVEVAKKMATNLKELSYRLGRLPAPSKLFIGSPGGGFVNTEQDARFVKENKKYLHGIGTDRIDLVGKIL